MDGEDERGNYVNDCNNDRNWAASAETVREDAEQDGTDKSDSVGAGWNAVNLI